MIHCCSNLFSCCWDSLEYPPYSREENPIHQEERRKSYLSTGEGATAIDEQTKQPSPQAETQPDTNETPPHCEGVFEMDQNNTIIPAGDVSCEKIPPESVPPLTVLEFMQRGCPLV